MKLLRLLLLPLLVFCTSIAAFGQLTVGTGTNEAQALPIEPYYGYTYSESIYLKSELGTSAGTITSIAWYYSGTSNLSNNQSITIWMGHTTKTAYTSTTDWVTSTGLTQVYAGNLGTPTGPGWITITLTTPFAYNNVDNLIIAVDENTPSYNSSADDFYCSASTGVQSIWYRDDVTNPSSTTPPTATGTASFYPNVKLGGLVATAPPTCNAAMTSPANAATNVHEDADVSWSAASASPTGYYLSVGTTSGGTDIVNNVDVGNVLTYALPTMAYSTTYYVNITPYNGNGNATGCTEYSFTTRADPTVTAPWSDDFESHAATTNSTISTNGWLSNPTATTASFRWDVDASGSTPSSSTGPSGAYSGVKYIYTEASSGTTGAVAEITSPPINVSALTVPFLKFYYHMYGSTMGTLNVDVYDGTTWHNGVHTITGQQQTADSQPWIEVGVNLISYSGSGVIKVRFRGIRGTDFYGDMSIDNFSVEEAPACINPLNMVVSNITGTSVDLAWTEGYTETAWNIEWTAGSDFTPGIGEAEMAVQTTGTPAYTATSLTPVTQYYLYYQADCGADSSDWIGPVTFTTVCLSTLNGTYTIGGVSPDYVTIGEAVTDLKQCGIGGPVTFNIAAGTYAESISIPTITGASAINTITFNGASAATTTITYDGAGTQNSTIELDGADYVSFKNLTITNTEATSSGWGIHLTNQANYNTIENCIVNLSTTTTTSSFVGILSSASKTSTGSSGNNANNTTIKNSTINGGYYGVYFYGQSTAAANNSNNKVEGCSITNAYYYALYMYYQDSPVLTDNTVPSLRNTASYPVYVNYAKHPTITKNKLYGGATYGIYMINSNTTTQSATARGTIANNMIGGAGTGIYLSDADAIDVFYNSVYSTGSSDALWVTTSSDNYDIRNNIFVSGSGTAVDFDDAPTATEVIDYNVYYRVAGGNIADAPSAYATLAAWQTATPAQNVHSLEGDPVFTSSSNLHAGGILADNAGTPIAGITDDIDGDIRNVTTPDIGADEYTAPTCIQPGALTTSQATSNSMDFSWTPTGGETKWRIAYGLKGFTISGAGTLVSADSMTITGLLPNTEYDFYVRASCGSGATSSWSGPVSAWTLCAATSDFSEKFDVTNDPALNCWSVYNAGAATANISTSYSYSPGKSFYLYNSNSVGVGLISPDLTNLAAGTHRLRFKAFSTSTSTKKLRIGTLDAVGNLTLVDSVILSAANAWQSFSIHFDNYTNADQNIIILHGQGTTYQNFYLDDITWSAIPTCFEVTNLNTAQLTATSVDAYWTPAGSETEWEVQYGAAGFTPGTGTSMVVTSDSVTISGLTVETNYDYYVRAICAPGDSGEWVGPENFYTGYCLVTSTNSASYTNNFSTTNGATNISNLTSGYAAAGYQNATAMAVSQYPGATVNFSAGFVGTTVGFNVWIDWNKDLDFDDAGEKVYGSGTYVSSATGTITVPMGTALDNYRMRIRCDYNATNPNACGVSGSGRNETEDYTFTVIAPPTCPKPSLLTATNVGSSSAQIAWTELGSATAWQIEYGVTGFVKGTGTTTIVGSNPYILTGLTSQTTYQVYVRAVCSPGDSSTWLGPISFTTLCAPFSVPFVETFDLTTRPNCWSVSGTGSTYWYFTKTWMAYGATGKSDNTGNGGSAAGFDGSYGNTSDATFMSPEIDLASTVNPTLTFDIFSNNTDVPGDNATMKVDVYSGGVWTNVLAYSDDNANWVKQTVDLSAYSGVIKLRFVLDNSTMTGSKFYNDIIIDNVSVISLPVLTPSITNATCDALGAINVVIVGGTAPFTYAWSNGASTATVTNLAAGTYTLTLTDAIGYSTAVSYTVENLCCPVAWVDLKYLTLNGTTLTKTSGGTGWNSAANSAQVLTNGTDGWVSMEVLETNTWRALGLATPNTVVHKNSITYGFLLRDNGKITIAEGTSSKGIFGDYSTGDILKVERVGTTIKYYRNGTLLYTSATPSTTDLIVDLSIQTVGGTIHNVGSNFTCVDCGTFALSTSLLRHESCTGVNDGGITIASSSEGATYQWADNPSETSNTRTGLAPGTYTVTGTVGLCTYTLSVVVNAGTACENMGCPVTWTNVKKSAVIGNTLKRTSTGTLWDAGANTNEVLVSGANGWASMQVAETNVFRTFGLSAPNTSASDTINYAFLLRSNGVVLVTENAVQVANLGTYATGDIFKVERVGTVVFYYQNGVVEYVSTAPSTTDLVVDASIKANNGTIYNVRTNFSCVDPCPIVWTSLNKTTVSGTTITKTGTGNLWDGAAKSAATLASGANGYASMEALETNTFRVFGLSTPNTTNNNTDITYAFQLRDNGVAQIVQNGVLIGSYGTYSTGDVFRVERFDTLIEYYRNNVLLYTSAIGSTTALIADMSIRTVGGTVHNVQTTFSCGAPRPESNVATTSNISNNTGVVNTFSDVTAYPNPFNDELILNYTENVEDVTSIELYNINGQHIRSIAISQDGQTTIDTSDLNSGLYIISINGVKHLKVVKM